MQPSKFLKILLYPLLKILSWIYSFLFWLDKQRHNPVRVPGLFLSVGNLSMGGTGKTPFVIFLLKTLSTMKTTPKPLPAAILMRGYHGEWEQTGGSWLPEKPPLLNKQFISPGDEAELYRVHLPSIAIGIGRDRIQQAKTLSKAGISLFILDDGLQHHKIVRDIDIVLLDTANPWEGGVLPLGRLRQSPKGLARAQLIVLTRYDQATAQEQEHTLQKVRNIAPQVPIIRANHRPGQVYPLNRIINAINQDTMGTDPGFFIKNSKLSIHYYCKDQTKHPKLWGQTPNETPETMGTDPIIGTNRITEQKILEFSDVPHNQWIAFSGIGKNSRFSLMLKNELGVELTQFFSFTDHFTYTKKNVTDILTQTKNFALTTEKDAVKIARLSLPLELIRRIYVVPLEIILLDSDQKIFSTLLEHWMKQLSNNKNLLTS